MLRRTALIIPVPEAEPIIGELRLAHDRSAALGVPAHVTILFPFVPSDEIDEAALAEVVGRCPAFEFTLDRVERFQAGTVWLHPEPSAPFLDLTHRVWQRWPEYPPYEGLHAEVIPHLTVSDEPIELELALPIPCRAREVLLIEEEEAGGRWVIRLRFPML